MPFRSVAGTGEVFDLVRAAAAGRSEPLVYSAAQTLCCGRDEAEYARRAAAIGRDPDDLRANGVAGTLPRWSTGSARSGSWGRRGCTCRPWTWTTSTTSSWSPPRSRRSCAEPGFAAPARGRAAAVFLAQLGFAVAFGVLLDAIVVRSLLVPALVYDLGQVVRWPSVLARREEPAEPEEPVSPAGAAR